MNERVDHVVIGGGAYGLHVATSLAEAFPASHVVLTEQAAELMSRASTSNHGRLHLGYMYPEHPLTARLNHRLAKRFMSEFKEAVNFASSAYYGIHRESKITADAYQRFCEQQRLSYLRQPTVNPELFGKDIVASFLTQEPTFSATTLRQLLVKRAKKAGVDIRTSTAVEIVRKSGRVIQIIDTTGRTLVAPHVFNCAYTGMNGINRRSGLTELATHYATFCLFKTRLDPQFTDTSATVMCGDYASIVPGADGLHILSHVVYSGRKPTNTPQDPSFTEKELEERFQKIITNASLYLPVLKGAVRHDQIIEAKTYPTNMPGDANRLVRFSTNHGGLAGYDLILGGKVSNIFEAGDYAIARVRQAKQHRVQLLAG
jgi:glycine/D-amino acid oxidase-like deaminating enzyme